jgi:UDP-glucuronate decarboxylase
MRILVTGGAGFLGSHLCEELLKLNHYVICVDNFYTSTPSNIEHLKKFSNFEVIRHDVTTPLFIEVDGIFNLACPASPPHYQRDPIQTTKTSVIGTLNMLELALQKKARFFQASTSEVYGDPEVDPQSEEYWGRVNPIGIRSCYDEGKRAAEALIYDYRRVHDVNAKIVRIFNTYGPHMHSNDGRAVSNFITSALKSEPIEIYGDGTSTRSFCYVDDLIEALITAMDTDFNFPILFSSCLFTYFTTQILTS